MIPLTEKEALFSKHMFTVGSGTFGNGTESARKAQYGGKNPTDNYLAMTSARLIRKDKIKAEKSRIQDKTIKKLDITETEILTKLRELAGFDKTEEALLVNNRDRLRALELLGKHLAMFTDVTKDATEQTKELTEAQAVEAKRLAELMNRESLRVV